MLQIDTIDHKGEVISTSKDRVRVLIRSASGCSSCHLKGACTSADVQDKYVDAYTNGTDTYSKGERVWVSCSDSQGFYALFWAYLLPLLLVLMGLFVTYALKEDELYAGIVSLSILPPYYFFLFVKKTYFDKKLKIKIKKIHL